MANKDLNVALPSVDVTASYEVADVTPLTVANNDVITVKKAFENKNDTMFLILEGAGAIEILAGNKYPNKVLGNAPITIATFGVINIDDMGRFENADNTIVVKSTGFTGKIVALAKRVGLKQK